MKHLYSSIPCCSDQDYDLGYCVFSVPKNIEICFMIQFNELSNNFTDYYLTVSDLYYSQIESYHLYPSEEDSMLVSEPFTLPNDIDEFIFEIMPNNNR